MIESAQINFCITAIRSYTNNILKLKLLKRSKYDEIREKITGIKNILDKSTEKTKEPPLSHNVSTKTMQTYCYEILLFVLESDSPELLASTLECLQKLISYNYLTEIFSQIKDNCTYLVHFMTKLLSIFKQHPTNENINLAIVMTFISLTTLDQSCLHILDLLWIIKIFLEILTRIQSSSIKSVLSAALHTIVMNAFLKLELKGCAEPPLNITIDDETNSANVQEKDKNYVPDGENSLHSSTPKCYEYSNDIPNGNSTENNIEAHIGTFSEKNEWLKKHCLDYQIDWSNPDFIKSFIIYEFLCKSSIVTILDQEKSSYQLTKVGHTLDMVYIALQNADNIFRSNECFTSINRKYLFVAITQPIITISRSLFKKSLHIFFLLLEKFRSCLKFQIQVYFNEILFKILESTSQPYDLVMCALEELHRMCSSVKFMSVLFVNYDCDMESHNIFEQLISNFCSIAKNPSSFIRSHPSATPQIFQNILTNTRYICLSCLHNILSLLAERADKLFLKIPSDQTDENNQSIVSSDRAPQSSFSVVKERKELLVEDIKLFALKPLNGINFLINHNFIKDDPDSIATFFHQEERLDPVAIGELLGRPEPKWLAAMHKYVEKVNVLDLEFLSALRLFLKNFRLPGEAQKIDRLMEKFASHYCEVNHSSPYFKTADSAYLLGYSIIMLTTALHNPNVVRKITPTQYINMNQNPDGTSNFPNEYLLGIYESILKQEISLKSTSSGNTYVVDYIQGSELSKITKMTLYNQKLSIANESLVEEVELTDATKSMITTIWKYLLVCFGLVFKETNHIETIYVCLNSIRLCVRISCLYDLTLIRDSFINSLLPFSLLSKNVMTFSDFKAKNLAAVRTILLIAKEDGNFLSTSWLDVLVCISNLEILHSIKEKANNCASSLLSFDIKELSHKKKSISSGFHRPVKSQSLQVLGEISSQQLILAIDQIFTNSVNFDADAIIHLVTSLCEVAKAELFHSKPPRTFTLQKILEVAYYNMNRTRIVWSNIWSILAPFLIEVSSLDNYEISIFCIDSIRQLSSKFLERKEFSNFHFQSEFFKPFEHIMKNSKFADVKELGLRCVIQIVKSFSDNINSGWKTVFHILAYGCVSSSRFLEEVSFESLYGIIDSNFASCVKWLDSALECIGLFCSHANSQEINIRSLKLLRLIFENFNNYNKIKKLFPEDAYASYSPQQLQWELGWKKILLTLVKIIQNSNSFMRAETILFLFNTLKQHQHIFEEVLWHNIFTILHSIFDILERNEQDLCYNKKMEWLAEMCTGVLVGTFDLYISNYERIPQNVFRDLIERLKQYISSPFEALSKTTLYIFKTILKNLHSRFNDHSWDLILLFIKHVSILSTSTILGDGKLDSTQNEESIISLFPHEDINGKYLLDYSLYQRNLVKNNSSYMSPEIQNLSKDDDISKFHSALSKCCLDSEFLEILINLLSFPHNNNQDSENPNQSILFSMPDQHSLELLAILNEHREKIVKFNSSLHMIINKVMVDDIQNTSHMEEARKDKKYPNMSIQEIKVSMCIVKLIFLICIRNSYNENYSNLVARNYGNILQDYERILSQATDLDQCHSLLLSILDLFRDIPQEFFLNYLKPIYKHIWPLVKISHPLEVAESLAKLFGRLEESIHQLNLV